MFAPPTTMSSWRVPKWLVRSGSLQFISAEGIPSLRLDHEYSLSFLLDETRVALVKDAEGRISSL